MKSLNEICLNTIIFHLWKKLWFCFHFLIIVPYDAIFGMAASFSGLLV